jgi:hypothetical protein
MNADDERTFEQYEQDTASFEYPVTDAQIEHDAQLAAAQRAYDAQIASMMERFVIGPMYQGMAGVEPPAEVEQLRAGIEELRARIEELEMAARCAVAALTQSRTFPADVRFAVKFLRAALITGG